MLTSKTKQQIVRASNLNVEAARADAIYFGGVGAFLGFTANTLQRAQEKGAPVTLSSIEDLLGDFMSVRAMVLLLLFSALICCARNFALAGKSRYAFRLVRAARQSTLRLRQFGSAITCFSLGFGLALGFTALFSLDEHAFVLAFLVAALGISAFFVATLGTMLHIGVGETRRAWLSALIAAGALMHLLFVIGRGFR